MIHCRENHASALRGFVVKGVREQTAHPRRTITMTKETLLSNTLEHSCLITGC